MPPGRFEIVRLGGLTVGRATYQPGWKWRLQPGRHLRQDGFILRLDPAPSTPDCD
jgi:hypothetical protein